LAEEREELEQEGAAEAPERATPRAKRRYSGGSRGGAQKRRGCRFCIDHIKEIDYKDYEMLRSYLTERGKIKPRRKNATCAKHQRRLALAIKRARHLALLPFEVESMRGQ
jgi:small subunit ribosomal protein S18